MFHKCLGIKTQEDFDKVMAFVKENNIGFVEGFPSCLFELEEAEFRIRELHTLTDGNGNEIEVTDQMVEEIAYELGEKSENYIDGESIDMIVSDWAKSKGWSIGF